MAEILAAILIISDRVYSGEMQDLSSPGIEEYIKERGWNVSSIIVVNDDPEHIESALSALLQNDPANLILTAGGTGFGLRDNTPEATEKLIEKKVPGLPELMRAKGSQHNPNAVLSRGVCGIACGKLIINLPGKPKAAIENPEAIRETLPHAIEMLPISAGHPKG